MNSEEFKKAGREIIDYIAHYRETVSERLVIPNENPGFLRKHVPLTAPDDAENWEDLIKDIDKFIVPGFTHWAHPHFHAYYPSGYSFVSILGCVITGAFGCIGDTWSTCPASTELEIIVLDWLAKLFDLPKKFLFYEEGSKGGGSLNGSASECTFLCLLAAQQTALEKLRQKYASSSDGQLLRSLVAYCSAEGHSSIEKACLMAMVTLRTLDTDDKCRFRGEELEKAVKQDIKDGLHPFFVAGTLGTTASSAVDKFDELGPICEKFGLWLHVDGAYGVSSLCCPEFRHFASGFEYASSIITNPTKWLLVNFDCSVMWLDDRNRFIKALSVDPSSVVEDSNTTIKSFCHWGTTNRRRFRALKLWFVMRRYGIQGLQKYIRNHVKLTKELKTIIDHDDRFEVCSDVDFGTICFRLKDSNDKTAKLLTAIVEQRKLFLIPVSLKGKYAIRLNLNCENMSEEDVYNAWEVILNTLKKLENS